MGPGFHPAGHWWVFKRNSVQVGYQTWHPQQEGLCFMATSCWNELQCIWPPSLWRTFIWCETYFPTHSWLDALLHCLRLLPNCYVFAFVSIGRTGWYRHLPSVGTLHQTVEPTTIQKMQLGENLWKEKKSFQQSCCYFQVHSFWSIGFIAFGIIFSFHSGDPTWSLLGRMQCLFCIGWFDWTDPTSTFGGGITRLNCRKLPNFYFKVPWCQVGVKDAHKVPLVLTHGWTPPKTQGSSQLFRPGEEA